MSNQHRETPTKRVNPSGEVVWVARYTGPDGKRRHAGTRKLKREAQTLIDAAYDHAPHAVETIGEYATAWTERHPRAKRTNATNDHRISRVLNVKVDGMALRHWRFRDLRRRHALELVTHMLTIDGRSATGVVNILRALSAMAEDAITDELADVNAFKGVKVRRNDPRIRKQSRQPRVWTFEQMHTFAHAARGAAWDGRRPEQADTVQAMVCVVADTGLRLGEVLPLERRDLNGDTLTVRGAAHEGEVVEGSTATKTHAREVPCPPGLVALLRSMPPRIDTPLLFPTPTGRLWRERNFYRDVWAPTVAATGMRCTPHEFRHSWVTHLRAAGIDPADLAAVAGHSVETATARYTHALNRSHDAIRKAVG